MAKTGFWDDREHAQGVVSQLSAVKSLIEPVDEVRGAIGDAAELFELAIEEDDAETLDSIPPDLDKIAKQCDKIEISGLLNRPDDMRSCFFSIHAGYAGMIESLVCLGQRLEYLGSSTPLLDVKHAYEYNSLEEAKEHLRALGEKIAAEGLGGRIKPLVIGVAGYGNVARGCQEILDCLPIREIPVGDLAVAAEDFGEDFCAGDGRCADFADFDSCGDVGERDGVADGRARGEE